MHLFAGRDHAMITAQRTSRLKSLAVRTILVCMVLALLVSLVGWVVAMPIIRRFSYVYEGEGVFEQRGPYGRYTVRLPAFTLSREPSEQLHRLGALLPDDVGVSICCRDGKDLRTLRNRTMKLEVFANDHPIAGAVGTIDNGWINGSGGVERLWSHALVLKPEAGVVYSVRAHFDESPDECAPISVWIELGSFRDF